jgi:hypothetical protein
LRSQLVWKLGNVEDIDNLTTFFDIFNDMYFKGVLEGFCKIEFVTERRLDRRFLCAEPAGYCDPLFSRK